MKSAQPAAEYTPIFDWSAPRSRKISIASFLVASAVLHLLCFYIFQIIYPPTIALLPPPARVAFITPDSEEGRVLLRWIEAEDPALSSITQRWSEAADLALPKTEHLPAYADHLPVLRELPSHQPDLSVPSSHPPAPVSLFRSSAPSASLVSPTEIIFSDEAAALGPPSFPPRDFQSANGNTPSAARFRVAIDSRGEVRYCMLEDSSGDPLLDQQARRYLSLTRFPKAQAAIRNDDLLWATATVAWGNDLAPDTSRAP